MKQLLQNLKTGETSVVDTPIPAPQAGEVLVRTAASLVSAGTERMLVSFAEKSLLGKARARPDLLRQLIDKARREGLLTTLEAAFNRLDQPMPLGYSSAGVVVALGAGVTGLRVGQRVACSGGSYAVHAEYVTVPRILATPLPEAVDFESAAFTTIGAIALHGFRLAQAQIGDCVAVIGLGLLGLLSVAIARAAGCRVIGVDTNLQRVGLARSLGGEAVSRDEAEAAARRFSRGRGCDIVLICADTASADPIELAGEIARDRGRIVATGAVGLRIPRKLYYEKELSLINSRSYGPGRYDPNYEEAGRDYPIGYVRWTEGRNFEAFLDFLASGSLEVKPLISHRFGIEQAAQAYDLITGKRKEAFLGVLLLYPASADENPLRLDEKLWLAKTDILPESKTAACRLGLLGAGNFASAVLLPAIKGLPGIERVGVASASGLSAAHAARKFGFAYAASQADPLVHDDAINTLAILTRHHLHASQAIAALQAGKHVFCEKPLALNAGELNAVAEALAAASAPNGRAPLLMVGFNRRFAPLAQRMNEFIAPRQEALVAHYRVNAGYIPLTHWLHDPVQGGGRIIGEACHFVDFLTFLVGQPPSTVTAHGLPEFGCYREDNVLLTFHFPDGSLGVVSYLANGDKSFAKERLEVFSGGRVAVLDDFRSLEMIHHGRRQAVVSRLRQDKGHRAAWQAFIRSIANGGPPPIPYAHLFGVTQATFAALEALRSGKTVAVAPTLALPHDAGK